MNLFASDLLRNFLLGFGATALLLTFKILPDLL
jgi:hypothetical protein